MQWTGNKKKEKNNNESDTTLILGNHLKKVLR